MKKLTRILVALLAVALIIAFAIPTFAGISYAPNGTGWGGNIENEVLVKKADSEKVIKDGLIGVGEYEKLNVDLDAENGTSPLFVVGFTSASLENALVMLPTMEFYFSWDEVHGFNFAVRNKPVVVQQVLEMADGACPQDDFARNTAYVINFKTDDGNSNLFYALAKRTDKDKYLEGFYTGTPWNQLGATHHYDPEQGVDYVISYGDDGYVTIEWSIPLNNFFVSGGGEGSVIEGTISATAGTAVVPFGGHDNEDSYAVALGDFGYGVDSRFMKNHVAYRLTGETININSTPVSDPTPRPDPTPTPTPAPISRDDPNTIPVDNQNANESGNENMNNTNSVAPRTGDPMITISALSALSLAGIIVIRKKRR